MTVLLFKLLATPPLIVISCVALAAALWMIGSPATDAASTEAPKWDLPVRMAIATALVLLSARLQPPSDPVDS
ncbi:MAG TPA: hypothetical protein VL742_03160 [Casimicrobiaceae bacterium]|nr:hypothetical protein [Casimicrobiaceae bacterium]